MVNTPKKKKKKKKKLKKVIKKDLSGKKENIVKRDVKIDKIVFEVVKN